jgi:UDP-GlcNAc:undecaprenyl-phosphate GlcNAc-1-phosphate transferase
MGDCGSLVVGFILALLCLRYPGSGRVDLPASMAVPVMVLMVPIFDTTLVTLIRVLSGRKASTGGRDHTSHRLVLMGLSERRAVLFLYGIGIVSGVAAAIVSRSDRLTSPAVIIPMSIAILLMGVYLAQLRVYPEKEFSRLRGHTFTPVLVELTYKRQLAMVVLDFGLVAFAYYLCYRLRFGSDQFPYYFKVFLRSLPAVIACKLLAFFFSGVYRGIWHYMGANDVFVHLKASTLATLLSITAVTYIYRFQDFSKGLFLIDWLLTTGVLLGTRGFFRLFGESVKRRALKGEKVLIYGAGRGGELLLRELLNNPQRSIQPLALIDDDPLKHGKKLQGFPILGGFSDLEALLASHPVSGLLVSYHCCPDEHMAAVKRFCKTHGLALRRFNICLDPVDLEA